jgi:predicted transposase YbfD/YdcC
MKKIIPASMSEHFNTITDPRQEGKTQHKLADIIGITICAVISGANSWAEIEAYGKSKYEFLRSFLELPHGIPSHDTFGRVFSILSTEEFEQCFQNWVKAVFQTTNSQVVAIDGKTLRRSHDRSSNKAAIHIVSAWASEYGITLGQVKTEEKSNEITAIPELLEVLDVKDSIVTIDAMGCQKEIAKKIRDKGADYVLALKGNHGNMHDDIRLFFEGQIRNGFDDFPFSYYKSVDGDHGRVEIRKYWTVSKIDWLSEKELWKDLKIIGMVESERHIGDTVSKEKRYYISSLENDAERFAMAVRSHWGIENSVHWILDIAFREDECRIRKGNGAANFAIIRHIALNLLKQEKTMKGGIEKKRLCAGWNNDYLLRVLAK